MSTTTAISSRVLYGVSVGVCVTSLTGLSFWIYKQWTKDLMPTKWRRVGTLSEVNIFPIKSCAPLKIEPGTEVNCDEMSAYIHSCRDRSLMLVDENDKIVTLRKYSKMVLIETTMTCPTTLVFSAPGMETPLELDFTSLMKQTAMKSIHTSVFGVKLNATQCGEKYDNWFSKFILQKENGLRLVYFAYSEPVRVINPDMKKEPFITAKDKGTFTDATSYMLMNISSVEDLNTRIPNPVDVIQFRGNFHLKMDVSTPYAEDNWGWVKIGEEAVFRKVAPCTRCVVPNVNVSTGERDIDSQPLRELRKYRKWDNYASPTMGIHLGIRQPGSVKVNDVVYVEDV